MDNNHNGDASRQINAALSILSEHLGTIIVLSSPDAKATPRRGLLVSVIGSPSTSVSGGKIKMTLRQRSMLLTAVNNTEPLIN